MYMTRVKRVEREQPISRIRAKHMWLVSKGFFEMRPARTWDLKVRLRPQTQGPHVRHQGQVLAPSTACDASCQAS